MTLQQLLIEEAETTYAITRNLARRVGDADLAWTPGGGGTEWMTMGQLLMHCASFGCGKAVQGFVRGDWGVGASAVDAGADVHVPPAAALPSVTSVAQALGLLEADRRLALACLADTREADLLTRRVAAPWGGPALPLFQQLLHMVAHLAQHKGQLFYYLKLMGREVGTSDLWEA
ncbi:MAG TPA: DinB family protein [Gemmatimonadales bacterium]|nr:DinB family protein [Gemmatimonadales bacterium]